MYLGGCQAQVGCDVPAREGGGLPVQANAAEGESRSPDGEPCDVEWSAGGYGDALNQCAAYAGRYGPYGEGVQGENV